CYRRRWTKGYSATRGTRRAAAKPRAPVSSEPTRPESGGAEPTTGSEEEGARQRTTGPLAADRAPASVQRRSCRLLDRMDTDQPVGTRRTAPPSLPTVALARTRATGQSQQAPAKRMR